MDDYHEQLYARKRRAIDMIAQVAVVLLTIALAAAVFILARAYLADFGRILGFIGAVGIVYLGYKIMMRFNVEFEYACFGGEITIDKIFSKTLRKREITVQIKTFDDFGIFDPAAKDRLSERHFDKQIDARSFMPDRTVYYATMKHKDKGLVLLVFEPDERTLSEINKIRGNAFSYNPRKK